MKFSSKALLIALGALGAAQAQAMTQGSGATNGSSDATSFYIGGSYIRSMYNIDKTQQDKFSMVGIPAGLTPSTTAMDDEDNGYEIHAGYMFVPNFGVEVGYADLGKFTHKFAVTDAAQKAYKINYDFATTAFTASLVGAYQLEGGLSVFGRLSGMYTTTKPTFDAGGSTVVSSYDKSEYNKFVPGAGIGAAFSINDQFRIRAEFDYWYQPTDNNIIAVKDLKTVVVGADVSFY